MVPGEKIDIEREMIEVHLLMKRGEYAEARTLLANLLLHAPNTRDILALQDELRHSRDTVKQAEVERRTWRYNLGLQTWWSRACWFLASVSSIVYALWMGIPAASTGFSSGFDTLKTTIYYGKYSVHKWTRPVSDDVELAFTILILAICMLVVLRWASKGAAEWEELDARDGSGDRSWWERW